MTKKVPFKISLLKKDKNRVFKTKCPFCHAEQTFTAKEVIAYYLLLLSGLPHGQDQLIEDFEQMFTEVKP